MCSRRGLLLLCPHSVRRASCCGVMWPVARRTVIEAFVRAVILMGEVGIAITCVRLWCVTTFFRPHVLTHPALVRNRAPRLALHMAPLVLNPPPRILCDIRYAGLGCVVCVCVCVVGTLVHMWWLRADSFLAAVDWRQRTTQAGRAHAQELVTRQC